MEQEAGAQEASPDHRLEAQAAQVGRRKKAEKWHVAEQLAQSLIDECLNEALESLESSASVACDAQQEAAAGEC